MRKFINRFGAAIIGTCLVLLIPSYFLTRQPNRGLHPNQRFYIDEETGEESVHLAMDIPPLVSSRGKPSLIQEVKFCCDGGKPFVAYYRKFDLESKARIEKLEKAQEQQEAQGIQTSSQNDEILDYRAKGELLRLPPAGSPWVPAQSPEGEKVRAAANGKNGQPGVEVFPQ